MGEVESLSPFNLYMSKKAFVFSLAVFYFFFVFLFLVFSFVWLQWCASFLADQRLCSWTPQVLIHLTLCPNTGSSPSHTHQKVHQQVLSSLMILSDPKALGKIICWTTRQQAAVTSGKLKSKGENYGI